MLESLVFNQIYFAVYVVQTSNNILREEKTIIFQSITMWAPHLVVAYLDFARCACRMHYIMQVVYKELTPDGVKSKVPKSKFHWYKMSKQVRIVLINDLRSIWFLVKFFQWGRIIS